MSTTQVEDGRFHIIRIVNQDDVKMDILHDLRTMMSHWFWTWQWSTCCRYIIRKWKICTCMYVMQFSRIRTSYPCMSRICELIQGPTHSFYVVFIPSNISTSNSVATSPFLSRLFYKTSKTGFKISLKNYSKWY